MACSTVQIPLSLFFFSGFIQRSQSCVRWYRCHFNLRLERERAACLWNSNWRKCDFWLDTWNYCRSQTAGGEAKKKKSSSAHKVNFYSTPAVFCDLLYILYCDCFVLSDTFGIKKRKKVIFPFRTFVIIFSIDSFLAFLPVLMRRVWFWRKSHFVHLQLWGLG